MLPAKSNLESSTEVEAFNIAVWGSIRSFQWRLSSASASPRQMSLSYYTSLREYAIWFRETQSKSIGKPTGLQFMAQSYGDNSCFDSELPSNRQVPNGNTRTVKSRSAHCNRYRENS